MKCVFLAAALLFMSGCMLANDPLSLDSDRPDQVEADSPPSPTPADHAANDPMYNTFDHAGPADQNGGISTNGAGGNTGR